MAIIARPFDIVLNTAADWRSVWSSMLDGSGNRGPIRNSTGRLRVSASGAGMVVTVTAGEAVLNGAWLASDSTETLTIDTQPAGPEDRIDVVVARITYNLKIGELGVVKGVSAAVPVPPTLTQNATAWEVPLAEVYVTQGASTIVAANVTDRREWSRNLTPTTFDAVIAEDGSGDYLLPSTALAAGALSMFIRNGVYNEPAQVVLPNNAHLVGESMNGTVISFADVPNGGFYSAGTVPYTTGTVTLTYGSPTVTGAGTAWGASHVGEIFVADNGFVGQVQAVTGPTSLTLSVIYDGATQAGLYYALLVPLKILVDTMTLRCIGATNLNILLQGQYMYGSIVRNVKTVGGVVAGIYLSPNAYHCTVEHCEVYGWGSLAPGNYGIRTGGRHNHIISCMVQDAGCSILSTERSEVRNCVIASCDRGITTGTYARVNGNHIDSCYQYGVLVSSHSIVSGNHSNRNHAQGFVSAPGVIFANNRAGNNDGDGFDVGGPRSVLTGNIAENNGGHGLNIPGDSCALTGNSTFGNGGQGLEISGNGNTVVANYLGGGINDTGIGNDISHNKP